MENKKYFFRNNSEKTWENYNVGGGVFVTIEPKSTFSVGERAAVVIRKNLCDTPQEGEQSVWIEEIKEKDIKKEEIVKKDVQRVDEKEVEKIKVYEAKRSKKRK